jgi:hypothetical protein
MKGKERALIVAAFVVLGHARSRAIDLGLAGERLLLALESAAPGSERRLNDLCPEQLPRIAGQKIGRQFTNDPRRKAGRVAKVDPVERKAVDLHELNGRA